LGGRLAEILTTASERGLFPRHNPQPLGRIGQGKSSSLYFTTIVMCMPGWIVHVTW
jgi:hypothetical protein